MFAGHILSLSYISLCIILSSLGCTTVGCGSDLAGGLQCADLEIDSNGQEEGK